VRGGSGSVANNKIRIQVAALTILTVGWEEAVSSGTGWSNIVVGKSIFEVCPVSVQPF